MNQPLVSIIMPTYNRRQLLAAAMRSVQAQTYSNWQLIVVDDGSTDGTREWLASLPSQPNVEYHSRPNGRQAAARNTGLRHCRGEYIASLDSDDEWHPDFLAVGMAQLLKQELDYVFLNWVGTVDTDGFSPYFLDPKNQAAYCTQPDDDWWLLSPAQARQLTIDGCQAPSSSLLLRRSSLVEEWNEQMRIADDWCLLLAMVVNRPCRAAFTMRPHWHKHVHETNIYDGQDKAAMLQKLVFHDEQLLVERFRHQLSRREKRVFRQRRALSYYFFMCLKWPHEHRLDRALRYAATALYLAPGMITKILYSNGLQALKSRLAPKLTP